MLTGTTLLQLAGTSNLVTPFIEAEISQNYMRGNVTGISLGTNDRANGSFVFGGRLMIHTTNSSGGSRAWNIHDTVDITSGFTTMSFSSLGFMYKNGVTLENYFTSGGVSDAGGLLGKVASVDGLNWGATSTLLANIGLYSDLSVVSPTQIYGADVNGRIASFVDNGGWGVTIIDRFPVIEQLGAFKLKGRDFVSISRAVDGVKTVEANETDGTAFFRKRELFSRVSDSDNVVATFINGVSKLYGYIYTKDNYIENVGGVTIAQGSVRSYLTETEDGVDWSSPRLLDERDPSSVDLGVITHTQFGEGLTNNTHTLFAIEAGATQLSTITYGSSQLDVSNDIISYTNNGNDRISLILGNKK